MKTQKQEQLSVDDTRAARGARLGRLLAMDVDGRAWIDFGNGQESEPAALAIVCTQRELEDLMANGTLLVIEGEGQAARVVAIVGKAASPAKVLQADVDGARVQLQAEKEVVIACGKASITLRANGRVIIRGTQIESYSEGTNRIKGAQVRIN